LRDELRPEPGGQEPRPDEQQQGRPEEGERPPPRGAGGGEGEGLLLPVDAYFARNGWKNSVTVRPDAEKRLRNGGCVPTPGMEAECRVYSESGEFLGLGSSEGTRLRLIKSFFAV